MTNPTHPSDPKSGADEHRELRAREYINAVVSMAECALSGTSEDIPGPGDMRYYAEEGTRILTLLKCEDEEQTPMHNVWALKREEVDAVARETKDLASLLLQITRGEESDEKLSSLYRLSVGELRALAQVVIRYADTPPQREAEPVALVCSDCEEPWGESHAEHGEAVPASVLDVMEVLNRCGTIYQASKWGLAREIVALYTSPPQLPDAQQERDHLAMEKLREAKPGFGLEYRHTARLGCHWRIVIEDRELDRVTTTVVDTGQHGKPFHNPTDAILSPEGDEGDE